MPRVMFTVKERDVNEPCFVCDEQTNVILELNSPADIEHAQEVKAFLGKHIRLIRIPKHPRN
jgi:hypothetical protein